MHQLHPIRSCLDDNVPVILTVDIIKYIQDSARKGANQLKTQNLCTIPETNTEEDQEEKIAKLQRSIEQLQATIASLQNEKIHQYITLTKPSIT